MEDIKIKYREFNEDIYMTQRKKSSCCRKCKLKIGVREFVCLSNTLWCKTINSKNIKEWLKPK